MTVPALEVFPPVSVAGLSNEHAALARLTLGDHGWMRRLMLEAGGRGALASTARYNGRLVGWVAARAQRGRLTGVDRVAVHAFVHPRFRRRGLAAAMLALLLPAVKRRWPGVRVVVLPGDEAGRKAFRRAGLLAA
jgi:ribosomal protein S18 acetylase RimI-like enzyme